MGAVVVVVVVVVVVAEAPGAIVGAGVDAGGLTGVTWVVGGLTGVTGEIGVTIEQPGAEVTPWSTGTVASVAPAPSRSATDVPFNTFEPSATRTTTPDAGIMVSTTVPVDDISRTDETPLPAEAATQLTAPPSASPKEPVPRI